MPSVGRKSQELFDEMLKCIIEHLGDILATAPFIRIVLDDSPTKRYGPKVEGAGYHHNRRYEKCYPCNLPEEATKWELLGSGFEKIESRLEVLEQEVQGKDEQEAVRKLRGYLDSHRERLGYRERLAEGRAIGSGQVEGACKSMIGRRLKQTGTRWNLERLNEMALLCSMHSCTGCIKVELRI